MNPHIASCYGQGLNQENDRKFDIIFDVGELTIKHEESSKYLDLYFSYVSAVVDLYRAICGGRHREATLVLRERIGATE